MNELPPHPKLVDNITCFARALRSAGLAVGPGRVIDAVRAVSIAGFTSRDDFYWALHSSLIGRHEHTRLFDEVFCLFWRDPRYLERMMALLLPQIRGAGVPPPPARAAALRAAEALLDRELLALHTEQEDCDAAEIRVDARQTASRRERLSRLDFDQMTTAEIADAKAMLATLRLPVRPLQTRRFESRKPGSRMDLRRSLRRALANGGEFHDIVRGRRSLRWPVLVVLCDISGSMSSYSRMALHFAHTVSNGHGQGWSRVHAFTMGTRLTNITRQLRARDVDVALAAAGNQAMDWDGGTRLGDCLDRFNREWSRRVLGQGAVVLLISDGLDRGDTDQLARVMAGLRRSCRRLVWLNPLLRWDGFSPLARGIQAMLPHVDDFCAGHSVVSLAAMADILARPCDGGELKRFGFRARLRA